MWTVLDEDPEATLARYGSLGVAILRASLDARFFDRVDATMEALTAEARFSMLIVRAGGAPGTMPAALRERARSGMERHVSRLLGVGYVLGTGGLKAKMIRGAMNAAMLGAPFPARTFGDVPSAVGWLLDCPGQPAALRAARAEVVGAIEGVMTPR